MDTVNKNILKLDKISKKDRIETEKNVSDTLMLLQSNEADEEIKMLKQIGLDHHIREAEKAQQDSRRFTVLESKFGRNVYSTDQIKKYCESEGYKIIRVDNFKHKVPVIVGEKIIAFAKENTTSHVRRTGEDGERVVERCEINLQTANFFLLTSIQSMNGAPVKHATLFYREEHRHDTYEYVKHEEMLIEVASWGEHGHETSLILAYLKETIDNPLSISYLVILFAIILTVFGNNMHYALVVLGIIVVGLVVITSNNTFWKWNLSSK